MTRQEALRVADLFSAIGGFSSVEIEHRGFWSKLTPELEADGKWEVELWSVSAKAGNRNLHTVNRAVSEKEAALIAKIAKGKASARDKAAFERMAAERAVDAE